MTKRVSPVNRRKVTGRLYLPQKYIGRDVLILLLPETEEAKE